jgi:hypothetical protein
VDEADAACTFAQFQQRSLPVQTHSAILVDLLSDVLLAVTAFPHAVIL